MSGFKKAVTEQAALKLGLYGPAGSGKSFTAQLVAEGLALASGKRVAVIDTERGHDFYCQAVPSRQVHPEAFDFDALHTRAITEALDEVRKLDPKAYSVVVIDSITHLWDACKNSYQGKKTKTGSIPYYAWDRIKKPYRDLMAFLLSSPFHVIICGRQGNEWEDDAESGEKKIVGVKMRAEGETQYEPHVLIRMEQFKPGAKQAVPIAHVEKDRTGVLSGRSIEMPSFGNIARPLMSLLGGHQAALPDEDAASLQDAEALARQEKDRARESAALVAEFSQRFRDASGESIDAVDAVAKGITKEVKLRLLPEDLQTVRNLYKAIKDSAKANGHHQNGEAPEPRISDEDTHNLGTFILKHQVPLEDFYQEFGVQAVGALPVTKYGTATRWVQQHSRLPQEEAAPSSP